MKILARIELLESRLPKPPKRYILIWIGRDGHTTKAADTHPHLPDARCYTRWLAPCQPGGGIRNDAVQTNSEA